MIAKTISAACLVAATLLAVAVPASAQGDGLYDEPPPPGSAFVRILAAQSNPPLSATVGDTSVTPVTARDVAPYQIIQGGVLSVRAGDVQMDTEFAAMRYYSVILHDGIATVIDDTLEANLTKSTIIFYTLPANDAMGLSTADGKTSVFQAVPAWSSASVAVNPISIAFGVNHAGEVVSSTPTIQLERGGVYSIIASGTEAESLTINKNTLDK